MRAEELPYLSRHVLRLSRVLRQSPGHRQADPAVASVVKVCFTEWKSGAEHSIFQDFIEKMAEVSSGGLPPRVFAKQRRRPTTWRANGS